MDSSPATPLATDPRSRPALLERGLLILVLLCGGVVLSKNYADPDLWGHVVYGRDLLREGLPSTATYSYTAQRQRWINHENLSEIVMAAGVDTFGLRGLLLLKFALGLGILALILRAARARQVPRPLDFLLVLLIAANLMCFWDMRPQIFSYFLFTVMIAVLDQGFPDGVRPAAAAGLLSEASRRRRRWLWCLPLLMAIWANTHGAFVAGCAILVVYLGGRSVEIWWRLGKSGLPIIGQLVGIGALSGLATVLNPYGWELHRWLFHSLSSPRPEILEWQPPELFSIVWIPLWIMVALLLASVLGSRRPRDWTQLALLAATLWQALDHRRHIPFLAILFGLWVLPHVASLLQRLRRSQPAGAPRPDPSPAVRWTLGLVATLAGLVVVANLLQQLATIPVKRNDYPVSAFEYIAERQLQGKLVARFKWAQYAIAAFAAGKEQPQLQVAFDGRFRTCYPQSIVDMYFDFAIGDQSTYPRYRSPESPPRDARRLLRDARPDLVLIDRQQVSAVQLMESLQDDWVLLYQDQLAQLWGFRPRYDDPGSEHFIPLAQRRISEAPQEGFAHWPALPTSRTHPQLTRRNPRVTTRES